VEASTGNSDRALRETGESSIEVGRAASLLADPPGGDGRCTNCRSDRPEIAVKDGDPFCSNECARTRHDQLQQSAAESAAIRTTARPGSNTAPAGSSASRRSPGRSITLRGRPGPAQALFGHGREHLVHLFVRPPAERCETRDAGETR
jgi:hypothetical protein